MSKIVLKTIDDLKEMLHSAIMYAIKKEDLPRINENIKVNIEVPADHKNGDFSSNVAMVYAKSQKLYAII